jgi:glutathione S-transferase
MLQICGRLSSINVRKVVWSVQELGLAHQRTDAGGGFGVVQTPAYRALSANALMPTIENVDDPSGSGPLRLWESNVIVRYLCVRHAPRGL